MKTEVKYIEEFGAAYLAFNNGIKDMHHKFFSGLYFRDFSSENRAEKTKEAAIKAAKKIQPAVEEALALTPPNGFVFAGLDLNTQKTSVSSGFRAPKRACKQEKKTDARIGKPQWLLYRLESGYDATFLPVDSDEWNAKYPRGAGASLTQPHQAEALQSPDWTGDEFTLSDFEDYIQSI